MPTTRGARRAAAARQILELPADVLSLVLYQLTLAHDIAAVAPTCRVVCDAVKLAMKARPFSSEVVTLAGHGGCVRCMAAAPDGRIITGSDDRTIKVWCDGACERTIQAHTNKVEVVAVLPGGVRFISGSFDGTVKLWTLDGALEHTYHVGEVRCAAALPDGTHFVVGRYSPKPCEVRLYHVDGTLVYTFQGHADSVMAVAVSRDGQHILSGSTDGVKVWNVATKSLVSTWTQSGDLHSGAVIAMAAMPDGQRILCGFQHSTVRVWLLNGTLKNTIKLHTGHVLALVALSDNQHALSGSMDNTVKLFNVNGGAVLRTFKHHTNIVRSLALLPDGRRFVSGSYDKTACIAYHGLAPFEF
jgi:WD40 repeat protein